MVIESRGGEAASTSARSSKRTMTDDLYTTFSSPMAWILVLALVITWSFVAVIMLDLADYKSLSGNTTRLTCTGYTKTACSHSLCFSHTDRQALEMLIY